MTSWSCLSVCSSLLSLMNHSLFLKESLVHLRSLIGSLRLSQRLAQTDAIVTSKQFNLIICWETKESLMIIKGIFNKKQLDHEFQLKPSLSVWFDLFSHRASCLSCDGRKLKAMMTVMMLDLGCDDMFSLFVVAVMTKDHHRVPQPKMTSSINHWRVHLQKQINAF